MRNPIRIRGDVAEIDLFDRAGNVIATALIDTDDVDRVADRRWVINRENGYVYAHGRGGSARKNVYLHRVIAGVSGSTEHRWVDHRNRNKLDNRKTNLRFATPSESNINKRTKRGDLKGVYANSYGGWTAVVTRTFATKEEAITWRRTNHRALFGEFAEEPVGGEAC